MQSPAMCCNARQGFYDSFESWRCVDRSGVSVPTPARLVTARQGFFLNQRSNEMETIKASELVEDFDLYPRGDVDGTHVLSLVQALEAGVELPPIIACKKTKRIVDGFHRRRAF